MWRDGFYCDRKKCANLSRSLHWRCSIFQCFFFLLLNCSLLLNTLIEAKPVDWIYHRRSESIFKPMPTWIVRVGKKKWNSIMMLWKKRTEIGIGAECALSQITCEMLKCFAARSEVHIRKCNIEFRQLQNNHKEIMIMVVVCLFRWKFCEQWAISRFHALHNINFVVRVRSVSLCIIVVDVCAPKTKTMSSFYV